MDSSYEALETTMAQPEVKKNKLLEAKELIEASQDLVAKVDSDVQECKVGISEAADAFDTVKRNFNNITLKSCEGLLEKAGYEYINHEESEEFELNVDPNQPSDFYVKRLSSGRFVGLLLATLVALLAVGAWIYYAATKLGIDLASVTIENSVSHINPVLTWIGGEMIGANGNMMIGALVLAFSALALGWVVYALYLTLKGNKNLRIAKEMHEKSNEYCMTQEECKAEMKRVDAHLREATREVKNFETILEEQAAVLKRILHVEGVYDEEKAYHPSSKKVMRETEKILKSIEKLSNTAITKNGKLNFQSVTALSEARAVYADYLSRIYD
ncbi:MAG TPA: hypothetical protein ENK82_07120 [Campylobacterales bacterium]|nr:hypothetical protein [Campylobacterales bacterium]HHS93102.1 hypothetical protein [Campylobacterales bacterium]